MITLREYKELLHAVDNSLRKKQNETTDPDELISLTTHLQINATSRNILEEYEKLHDRLDHLIVYLEQERICTMNSAPGTTRTALLKSINHSLNILEEE